MPTPDTSDLLKQLTAEIENFEGIARAIQPLPGEVPRLDGIDIYGGTLPLNGVLGGDHLIYLDFKQRFDLDARIADAEAGGRSQIVENLRRCQHMAGVVLIDVSGHRVTDALLAAMLHQAFLLGAIYELDMFGHVTGRLFENLNSRFYQSSAAHKFVSMIYGEISEESRFRFISAAQPFPVVFSRRHEKFMHVDQDLRVSFPPLGIMPSLDVIDRKRTSSVLGFKEHYQLNEWLLMGEGDILILPTDGLMDHRRDDESYFPDRLETLLRRSDHRTARELFDDIVSDLREFAAPEDDISMVIIRKDRGGA
jgi:serine phosphatase RsbU (regulator of sigma subunit)